MFAWVSLGILVSLIAAFAIAVDRMAVSRRQAWEDEDQIESFLAAQLEHELSAAA